MTVACSAQDGGVSSLGDVICWRQAWASGEGSCTNGRLRSRPSGTFLTTSRIGKGGAPASGRGCDGTRHRRAASMPWSVPLCYSTELQREGNVTLHNQLQNNTDHSIQAAKN